jgi:signal transduction histidine kinase
MGFNGLVTSLCQYKVTLSSVSQSGVASGRGIDALFSTTSAGGSATQNEARTGEQLAERQRIAQELHDTLLQGFFAVSIQLHTAMDLLPVDCPANAHFSTALESMERALEEGRRAVQGLRSSNEDFPSLGQALAAVPNDLGLPSAVGFRVVVEGRQRELRAGLRYELYRIGREAIVNAYRHSRAKEIETEIQYRPKGLRIAVRDNGCGIHPQELQREPEGHWGLRGMRERAERIGARLRILSRVALGTEVELCVPDGIAFQQR